MLSRIKPFWLLWSVILILGLILVACGGDDEEAATAAPAPTPRPAATSTPVPPGLTPPPATPAPIPTPAPTAEPAPTGVLIQPDQTVCTPEGAEPLPGGTLSLTGYDPETYDTSQLNSWEGGATKSFTHVKLTMYKFCDPLESSDMTPYPDLAESWEISPDGLTVTFHLRQGVRWQDIPPVSGREVVADDVVFSYARYMAEGSPHAAILAPVDSVEAPDNYTVVFNLNRPWASLLPYTASLYFVIEAPEVLEEFGTYETPESVIGAGPWILVEHDLGVRQFYEKNPDYYRGANGITGENLPYIDNIDVLFIFDDAAKLALYRGGDLDVGPAYYYWGYWTGDTETLAALEGSPELTDDFRAIVEEITTEVFLMPRLDQFPFSNQKIRQAVSMVLDRSYGLWYDGASLETRELVSRHPWFVPLEELGEGAQFYPVDAEGNPTKDFEGASQLLRAGLIEEGHDPDERIQVPIYFHRLETIFEDAASVFQSDLAQIGIDLDLRVMEYGEMSDTIWDVCATSGCDFDGMAFDWKFVGYPDPLDFFYNNFSPGVARNYQGIDDPEINALLELGIAARDEATQREVVEDLQKLLAVKQYWWPMPNWITYNLYPSYLKNVGAQKGGAGMGLTFLESWFTSDAPAR